jgi:hypothetical protein
MYPLSDQGLAVSEVVEHWVRSIPEHPTFQELVTRLLQAYWRGDLRIHPPSNPRPTEPVLLLGILHDYVSKRSDSEDFEIVFYEDENELPEDLVELPDGSMLCDNRTRIRLPHDPNHWSPDVLAQAFERLQTLEFQAFPRDAMTGFLALSVDRDAFGELCDHRGWPRPSFWFSGSQRGETRRSLASARTRARKWLRDQTRGSKRQSKEGYWVEASAKFPGLSKRAFDAIWAKEVPPPWRQPGAPKRVRRRTDCLP